jgi:2-phosphosulfolactate phosphatase
MLSENPMMTTPGFKSGGGLFGSQAAGAVSVFTCPAAYERVEANFWTTRVVVVFDVLRATSTLAAILSHPGNRVVPCISVEEARLLKERQPGWLLAGEREGVALEGFDRGNSPREWDDGPSGTSVIQTTTNGTRALRACAGARALVAGALVNGGAVARYWKQEHSGRPLALVLAGTGEDFALEDAVGAGWLMRHLGIDHPWCSLAPRDPEEALRLLHESRNGRRLVGLGLAEDVAWCARLDVSEVVPVWEKDALVAWGTGFKQKVIRRR